MLNTFKHAKLVVVIPTYGKKTLLERTLLSLSECVFPEEYTSTIVIENGPKGEAEQICSRFLNINCQYQYSPRANKSAALNQALKFIDDDPFIIFFDDDIRIDKNILISYLHAFKKHGNDYFYGGPFGIDYEQKPKNYYLSYLPYSARGWEYDGKYKLKPIHLIGFNWAVSKNNLDMIGEFNPRFGPNSTTGAVGQEHEMMIRLNERGIQPMYIPDAKAWHYVPKQRSTFKWAIMRKFKGGLSYGLNEKNVDIKEVKKNLVVDVKGALKAFLQVNRANFMHHMFGLIFSLGVKKGVEKR